MAEYYKQVETQNKPAPNVQAVPSAAGKKTEGKKVQTATKKKGSWLKQILLSIMLLLIISVTLIMILPNFEKDDITLNEKNSDIYSLLVAVGITDALVDATPERVVVFYELPADLEEDTSLYYAMGAVAGAMPDTEKVIVQPHVNAEPKDTVGIAMQDINEFIGGKLTDEEFSSKLITGDVIAAPLTPADLKGPLQSAAFTLAVVLATAGIGSIFRERLTIGAKINDLLDSLRRGREERAKKKTK